MYQYPWRGPVVPSGTPNMPFGEPTSTPATYPIHVYPPPPKIKSVEYHPDGTIKRVEYEN